MGGEPPDLAPNDILTAEWLNALKAWIRSMGLAVDPRSGLVMVKSGSGTRVGLQATPDLWVQVTYVGPTGQYSWIEKIETQPPTATSATWVNGNTKGYVSSDPGRGGVPSDPLWEVDANSALAVGFITRAVRDPASGQLLTQGRKCP